VTSLRAWLPANPPDERSDSPMRPWRSIPGLEDQLRRLHLV